MLKIKILNSEINNISMNELLSEVKEGVVFTPNVDHLMMLQRDKDFYNIYKKADYIICDSKIIQICSKFLKTEIIEKISGSDFFPSFYEYHKNNQDIKIFLLGAASGVAEKAAYNINKKIGRNIIVGFRSPSYGFEKDEKECSDIINQISDSGANVLAVGVGAPKQEKWIFKYKDSLHSIKIFMGIGATIDFEAGNVKRSPKIISDLGLEWFWRLISDPKRLWKRYIVNDLPFFPLIIKQKLGLYHDPFNRELE